MCQSGPRKQMTIQMGQLRRVYERSCLQGWQVKGTQKRLLTFSRASSSGELLRPDAWKGSSRGGGGSRNCETCSGREGYVMKL